MTQIMNSDSSDPPPDAARILQERKTKAEKIERAQQALAIVREEAASIERRRMNLQVVEMIKRPAKPKASKSIKGIGLYTHVEGALKPGRFSHERHTPGEPVFLPIGGPDQRHRVSARSSALDEDVKELWKEVQSMVQKEEAFCQQTPLGVDDLKKRYGALEVNGVAAQPRVETTPQVQAQQQDVEMQDDIALQERRVGFAQAGGARRPSWGREAVRLREEERGDEARGRLARRNSSAAVTAASTYEASRDPRLRH